MLKRDAGQFTFGDGTFYLLTPIGGRTMGAVFLGHGVFSFSPPSRIEQERLARFQKTRTLEVPFSSVVLLFADSTLAELESKLTFGPGQPPSEPRQRFKDGLDYLADDDSKSFDPDLMAAFLNGESSDLFYAHIDRTERRSAHVHAEPPRGRGGDAVAPRPARRLDPALRGHLPVRGWRGRPATPASPASGSTRPRSAATTSPPPSGRAAAET